MKSKLPNYRGYKLTLVDTDDSYWVSFTKGNFQDCTERFNDEISAHDAAKNTIDKLSS